MKTIEKSPFNAVCKKKRIRLERVSLNYTSNFHWSRKVQLTMLVFKFAVDSSWNVYLFALLFFHHVQLLSGAGGHTRAPGAAGHHETQLLPVSVQILPLSHLYQDLHQSVLIRPSLLLFIKYYYCLSIIVITIIIFIIVINITNFIY